MGWKVVEINTDEYFKLYLNNIVINRQNEKIMININDIDTLIIHNPRANFSFKLLNKLTSNNVNIIIFNESYEPQSIVVPLEGNYNSFKVFNEQLKWTGTFKGKCWQQVVREKIKRQTELLYKEEFIIQEDLYKFEKYENDVRLFDITNREGHVAKVYFNLLFGLDFIRDQKAIKNHVINSILNYGYAIVRSLVIRSIIKKGLDPRISFFHKSWTNFYALASDLMEPFRPLVDKIALGYTDADLFSFDIRNLLAQIPNLKVKINGKSQYVNNAVDIFIDCIVRQDLKWELELWD